MYKLFLSIGNKSIEETLRTGDFEIVDTDDSLSVLYDLLDYIQLDAVIINRLLDSGGEQLIRIAEKAKQKNIKLVVLVNNFEAYEERKLITSLVNTGVTAFINIKDITAPLVQKTLDNYPAEFDFSVFSKPVVQYREIVKSVFKEVIAIYSPTSEGASTVASHLATALASSKNCTVCLADFNPLKPKIKAIFDMSTTHTLTDALNGCIKGSLTPSTLQSLAKQSKYHKNLDILFGLYDLNDFYASKVEQYEEIIEKLKFSYDYVIIDTHSWHDVSPTDAALSKADRVIVPVKGSKYSIHELHRYLDMFNSYNDFDVRKFGVVINKYGSKDLTSIELAAMVKYPILGYISRHNGYDDGNCFKDRRVMNEYISILNAIGIDAKKKGVILC